MITHALAARFQSCFFGIIFYNFKISGVRVQRAGSNKICVPVVRDIVADADDDELFQLVFLFSLKVCQYSSMWFVVNS